MICKLIVTPLMAFAVSFTMFAPAESRGGFAGGGFHPGFGGFRANGSGGSIHRGSGGFHQGFGGGLRHGFAGRFRHRVWGPGWAWWGFGVGSLAYGNSYYPYPYHSDYSPNYEDSYLDNNDVNSRYEMPYPYYDGGYWQHGQSLNRNELSGGDLGEGWRTCPMGQEASCVITIP